MKLTATNLNRFLFFKLPSAFICGVRVVEITSEKCVVAVKHRWINQNPFHSMYFAVQAMAAELTTGAIVMLHIEESGHQIGMLVAGNKSVFTKKATGKITFVCQNPDAVKTAIQNTITTAEGQTFWLKSIGTNENGEQVSEMDFEWTIKLKK
ncbi:DUF4442 domain-containing protein [Flavobacterium flavipallidum]|uniref:DUF4442 domain-containing protein n=1 Tax=Flavobacterium flavipallidum TaxID=3139140 RepID=A0ABU9HPS0_9FLAO